MIDQAIKPNVSQIDFDDINTFIKFLNKHANHTLVLNFTLSNVLSVDQVDGSTDDARVESYGGSMLIKDKSIDGFVFEPKVFSLAEQVQFLKKTNLPYSKAMNYTGKHEKEQLKRFISKNNVNTIVLWNEGQQFHQRILEKEGYLDLFEGKNLIFAEKVLADALGLEDGSKEVSINYLMTLLNIPESESEIKKYTTSSTSFAKSQKVKKILQTYMYLLSNDTRKDLIKKADK